MGDQDKESGRERRLRDYAFRMFRDSGSDDPKGDSKGEPRRDAREFLGAVLETGDKAKTEVIRLVAREIRGYLEALELHQDLHHLLTNYSLEVKASFHLKPLKKGRRGHDSEDQSGQSQKPDPEVFVEVGADLDVSETDLSVPVVKEPADLPDL